MGFGQGSSEVFVVFSVLLVLLVMFVFCVLWGPQVMSLRGVAQEEVPQDGRGFRCSILAVLVGADSLKELVEQ